MILENWLERRCRYWTGCAAIPSGNSDAINICVLESLIFLVGECDDGGFYLLGLRSVEASLFHGIEWSTDRVAEQMRQAASRCGLRCADLDTWYDIDRPDDLVRAVADMKRADCRDDYELMKVIENALSAVRVREGGLVR